MSLSSLHCQYVVAWPWNAVGKDSPLLVRRSSQQTMYVWQWDVVFFKRFFSENWNTVNTETTRQLLLDRLWAHSLQKMQCITLDHFLHPSHRKWANKYFWSATVVWSYLVPGQSYCSLTEDGWFNRHLQRCCEAQTEAFRPGDQKYVLWEAEHFLKWKRYRWLVCVFILQVAGILFILPAPSRYCSQKVVYRL